LFSYSLLFISCSKTDEKYANCPGSKEIRSSLQQFNNLRKQAGYNRGGSLSNFLTAKDWSGKSRIMAAWRQHDKKRGVRMFS